jgi:uncharacterized protein
MLMVRTRIAPSPIQGIGVFAAQFIPKGIMTWRFTPGFDLIVTPKIERMLTPFALEQVRKYSYVDLKTGQRILCSDDSRFYNHSDRPNTGIDPSTGDYTADYAFRDIEIGEEITSDYRTFDAESARELVFMHEMAK